MESMDAIGGAATAPAKSRWKAVKGSTDAAKRRESANRKAGVLNMELSHIKEQQKALDLRRQMHYKQVNMDTGDTGWLVKIAYGAPTMIDTASTIMVEVGKTYFEALGMKITVQAAVMAVARSLDVLTDPSMAYITDNFTGTKYGEKLGLGRRRPFILGGCFLVTLVLCLLFYPPCGSTVEDLHNCEATATMWFAMFYPLFFVCQTIISIPYNALGPELSDDAADQNVLFSISNLFTISGMMFGVFIPQGMIMMMDESAYRTSEYYADKCMPQNAVRFTYGTTETDMEEIATNQLIFDGLGLPHHHQSGGQWTGDAPVWSTQCKPKPKEYEYQPEGKALKLAGTVRTDDKALDGKLQNFSGWNIGVSASAICNFEDPTWQAANKPTDTEFAEMNERSEFVTRPNSYWKGGQQNPYTVGARANKDVFEEMYPLFNPEKGHATCNEHAHETALIKWFYNLDVGVNSKNCFCKTRNRGIDCNSTNPFQPAACYCNCVNSCKDNDSLHASRNGWPLAALVLGMYYIFTCLFAFRNLSERGWDDAEAYDAGVVPSWPLLPLCPSRPAGGAAAANRGHSDSHHVHLEEGEELNEKITNKTKASERKADPLVTNMLNTMNNKPFTQLLPAWTCDSIGVSVLTSFVLYEVFYVIEVEYQNGCEFGDYTDCMAENLWYKNFNCNSMHVVGACICSLIMGAMIALPVWTHLAKEKNLGNFKTWLLWSLVNAVTNSLLVFVGKGQIIPLLVILFINGLPMGAQFLSDSILSDVIDYDEFLTGKRNEATYTMFRSFLPKMAAIPASVLPLAFLPATGYLPPVNGMVVQQPLATHWYVRICFAVIPFVFAMLSYHFKTKFVMRTDAQHVKIKAGCGMHMKNLPSKCPLSGVMVTILQLTPEEEEMEGLMGHFPGVNSIRMLTKEGGENDLVALASSQLSKLRAGLVFSAIIAIYTLVAPANIGGLLEHPVLSFIPVLGVVCTGVLLVGTIGCYLRKVAALQIAIHMKPGGKITKELIKKTLAHRSMIHATFQKVNAISKGKEPPMPVSPVPSKTNPTPEPSSAAAL